MIAIDTVREEMTRRDIDVMMLGREANARAVAGTTRLWLAGTRAFAPSCVVVRDPGTIHVLAITDDAVPPGFPVEHLFGITWNPDKLRSTLTALPGVPDARRVAVDGMTPMMHAVLASVMPNAVFVDASPMLSELLSRPDAERVDGVRAALAVAHAGMRAMADSLRPGVRPRALRGACAEAFAALGVTTPAFEAIAAPLGSTTSTWFSPERVLAEHERVVLRAGAIRNGWDASIARTYTVGDPRATERETPTLWHDVLAACRAGTTVGELRDRGAVVYGVSYGVEPWDDEFVLAPGLTCAVEATAPQWLRQDIVLVTEGDAQPLLVDPSEYASRDESHDPTAYG